MNWLAHILLSKQDIHYQLGNFLADPLKAKTWNDAPPALAQGMQMHKAIDVFTDAHAVVSQSKARLGKKGYLKGVVIDLLYDHFLSALWSHYASDNLSDFLQHFYANANSVLNDYPAEPQKHIQRLIHSNQLGTYTEFKGFEYALKRVDARLSSRIKAKDTTLNYTALVQQNYDDLQTDFEVFFPDLIAFYKNHALGSPNNHFFID